MKYVKLLLVVFFLLGVSIASFSTALAVRNSSQESDRSRKRDEWQRPGEVMDALGVKSGYRSADLVAGYGYFTFRLAARVGADGKVYAVDIDEEAINKVRQRKEREKLEQVEPILSVSADPRLPNDLDAVLIVDSYHEFREYDQSLQAVFRALKPGGRFVIIDGEAPSGRPRTEYHRLHSIPLELVREEVTRHGFVFKESRPGFYDAEYGKKMYFLIFEKPKPVTPSKNLDPSHLLARREDEKMAGQLQPWPAIDRHPHRHVSENELQRKLRISVLLDIVDVVEQAASRRLDCFSYVAINIVRPPGDKQIRMIEEIEELCPELQLHLFRDRDVSEEAYIPSLQSRRTEGIASERADERPVDGQRVRKRAEVEVVECSACSCRSLGISQRLWQWSGHYGADRLLSVVIDLACVEDCERESGTKAQDPIHRPSVKDHLEGARA